jgi:hypothetical protein
MTMGTATMKGKDGVEHLMSERWPKLRERAQNARNPEKLIKVLEEIDDLLFNVEMRVAAQGGGIELRCDADSKSADYESGVVFPEDQEAGSNE